ALGELACGPDEFALSLDPELPLVNIDAVQMERAFVNVLENARRHSGGHPLSVRARAVRSLAGGSRLAAPSRGSVAGERPGGGGGLGGGPRRGGPDRRPRRGRAAGSRRRSWGRPRRRSRARDTAGAARARLRAVLSRRHARRRTTRLGAGPGDRA